MSDGKSIWNEEVKQSPEVCYNCFTIIGVKYIFRGTLAQPGNLDSARVISREYHESKGGPTEKAMRRNRTRTIKGNATDFDGVDYLEDVVGEISRGTYDVCECGSEDNNCITYKDELTKEEAYDAFATVCVHMKDKPNIEIDVEAAVSQFEHLIESSSPNCQFEAYRDLMKKVIDENCIYVEVEAEEVEFVIEE